MLADLGQPSTSGVICEYSGLLEISLPQSEDDDDDSLELNEDGLQIDNDTVDTTDEKTQEYNAKLKNELRNKIQERRLSKGERELNVSFEPPKTYKLTDEEKKKCELRRQRNRDSANRSRLKRKFQLDYLEQEVKDLTKERDELMTKVSALRKVKDTLDEYVHLHNSKITTQRTEGSSSTCSQILDIGRPCLNSKMNDYNRGRVAFQSLSQDQQIAIALAFAKQKDRLPGTPNNG